MTQDGDMFEWPRMSLRPVDHVISPRMGPEHAAKGVACSKCGHIIPVKSSDSAAALLELQCTRCGTSDVYHNNALRSLPHSPQKAIR
jgi:DNA-directed RNA polymerase subunit RPC12/RpoP